MERTSVHELHNYVKIPSFRRASIVKRHDARVRKAGHGLRLANEAAAIVFIARNFLRQQLDGHHSTHRLLVRLVNGSHPPVSDQLENLEVWQKGAYFGRR